MQDTELNAVLKQEDFLRKAVAQGLLPTQEPTLSYTVSDAEYYKLHAAQVEVQAAQAKLELAEEVVSKQKTKLESLIRQFVNTVTKDGEYTMEESWQLSETNRILLLKKV